MRPQAKKILDAGTSNPIVVRIIYQFTHIVGKGCIDLTPEARDRVPPIVLELTKDVLRLEKHVEAYRKEEKAQLNQIDRDIPKNQQASWSVNMPEAQKEEFKGAIAAASTAINHLMKIVEGILSDKISGIKSLRAAFQKHLPKTSRHRAWLNEDIGWLHELLDINGVASKNILTFSPYLIERKSGDAKALIDLPRLRRQNCAGSVYLSGLQLNVLSFCEDVLFLILTIKCLPGFRIVQVPEPLRSMNENMTFFVESHDVTFKQHIQKLFENEQKYGKVKPIISVKMKEKQFVAVGNKYMFGDYKDFHNFLDAYIVSVLEPNWGQTELAKPYEERHEIIKWYSEAVDSARTAKAGKPAAQASIWKGVAYRLLAYDLYTTGHNSTLQKRLIGRLKHADQFQGARYELFAIATCIRAGFEIEYEDETGPGNHFEFTGVHIDTKQRVSVEAKSRHRPNVLGYKGPGKSGNAVKADVGQLINQALKNARDLPHIVFIDLNLPPAAGTTGDQAWYKEIQKTVERNLGNASASKPDIFNLMIFTNHPFHYSDESISLRHDAVGMYSRFPKNKANYPFVIQSIHEAAMKFGNIPKDFPK